MGIEHSDKKPRPNERPGQSMSSVVIGFRRAARVEAVAMSAGCTA